MKPEPSPIVREILKDWCRIQEQRYGPEWKKRLANEMAERAEKALAPLLAAQRRKP